MSAFARSRLLRRHSLLLLLLLTSLVHNTDNMLGSMYDEKDAGWENDDKEGKFMICRCCRMFSAYFYGVVGVTFAEIGGA